MTLYKIISLIFIYAIIGILVVRLTIYTDIRDAGKEERQKYFEEVMTPGWVFFLTLAWPLILFILIIMIMYETLILGGWGIDDENR